MTTLLIAVGWYFVALAFALAVALPICAVAKRADERAGIDLDS